VPGALKSCDERGTLRVIVNGDEREVPEASTVADAVALSGAADAESGIAVAVGGEVVPRGEWRERRLSEGETVEVVHAVQGG
jgi:sulfur carrier protein